MNHTNHDSKMMWWMLAGCLLLPLGFLFFGNRAGDLPSKWIWFSIIGVFMLAHIFMMLRGHSHDDSGEDKNSTNPSESQDKHHVHDHD